MSQLEKIIYLADYIEPNRTPFEGLEEARTSAFNDLNEAMKAALTNTINYVRQNNKIIHPLTVEALEFLNLNEEDQY